MLVPLKVKIGLRVEKGGRRHDYPRFNDLAEDVRGGMDWSIFVDNFGGGWKYDAVSGHDTEDAESPRGFQFGMLLVPETFAVAAVEAFPDQCAVLDETEAKTFYEDRHTVNQPEVNEDTRVLQAIAAKRAAGIPEDEDDRNAMDPDKPTRGRTRNKTKSWDGYKQHRGIVIDVAALAAMSQ